MRSPPILAAVALVVLLVALPYGGFGGAILGAGARERAGAASGAIRPRTARAVAHEEVPAAGERVEAASSPASLQPTCVVRVVLASSGAPVPDASAWIQRDDVEWTSAAWRSAMRRSNDVEVVLASGLGRELALDARGEARVPLPTRRVSLAAALGDLHGEATLEPGDGECVVALEAYHALACEVVDRAGRPVPGAPVALTWGELDPRAYHHVWVAGEDGRVTIAKVEAQLWPDGYRGPVLVTLAAGVPCEPEHVTFTVDAPPSELVRLVAGDFGRVVVQASDAQGRELALDGFVFLEPGEDAPPHIVSSHDRLHGGRAVFASVGLGLSLEICVSASGHANTWREALGPTEPGEEVRVLVPIGERSAIARGVVRGVRASFAGARPAGARLDGRPRAGGGSFSVWVADDGPFEGPIRDRKSSPEREDAWTLDLYRQGGPYLRATVTPDLDATGSVLDFGDVVFEPRSASARVRVVDDAGAPVPWAGLEVSLGENTECLTCDEEGRCRLFAGAIRVRATHRAWCPSEWARLDDPESEHTLVLRRPATLVGRLLLPRASDVDTFELDLSVGARDVELAHDGRFRLLACESGRAILSISYDGRPVLERAGIELRTGETTELEPIDLGGVLHPFELAFELESGEPWSGGHLELVEPDGEPSTWIPIGRSARAAFLAQSPSVDLWVAGKGARAVRFEGVLDGANLVLPEAPSVVLRVPRDLRLPEPPLVLVVRGEHAAPDTVPFEPWEEMDVADAAVGEDGTVRLRMPWPGDYVLSWSVRHTGTGVEFAVVRPMPQTVRVPSTGVVEAELTSDEVARAVADAGG